MAKKARFKIIFHNSHGPIDGELDSKLAKDEIEAAQAAIDMISEANELQDGDGITVTEL